MQAIWICIFGGLCCPDIPGKWTGAKLASWQWSSCSPRLHCSGYHCAAQCWNVASPNQRCFLECPNFRGSSGKASLTLVELRLLTFCQAKDDNNNQQNIQKGPPTADLVQNVCHLQTDWCSCRTRGDADACFFIFSMCLPMPLIS